MPLVWLPCGCRLITEKPVKFETGSSNEFVNNAILELNSDSNFHAKRMRLYRNYGDSEGADRVKFAGNLQPCLPARFKYNKDTTEICEYYFKEFKLEEW